MGLLDGPIRQVSAKLIPMFGKPATLRLPSTAYDKVTRRVTGAPVDTPIHVVEEDFPTRDHLGGSVERDGQRVRSKKFTMAASEVGFQPDNRYQLIVGGVTWTVVKVDAVSSGEQDAIYIVQGKA